MFWGMAVSEPGRELEPDCRNASSTRSTAAEPASTVTGRRRTRSADARPKARPVPLLARSFARGAGPRSPAARAGITVQAGG